jgi:hypothetical protein
MTLLLLAASGAPAACGGGKDESATGKHSNGAEGGEGGEGAAGGTRAHAGRGPSAGAGHGSSGEAGTPGGVSNAGGEGGVSSAQGGAGGAPAPGLAFPLTLTPIGSPLATTAHVSLYFNTFDANNEPVGGLTTTDFVAKEDGAAIDVFESAFQVTKPKGALVIPTVLLLDLSRSVVEAGALDELKQAADRIIDDLDPAQRLAIATFAQDITLRQSFTTDKAALHATIEGITKQDGVTTNLYGALISAYGLWQDGFRKYDPDATEPQLVAGLMIPISDGSDTADLATLDDVLTARGTKRTIFIRVGEDNASVPKQIANAGVITAAGGFSDLTTAVDAATARIAALNDAIYAAEYCSPKRAGSHELVFTVKGNESYVSSTPSTPATGSCSAFKPTKDCQSGFVSCPLVCCPQSAPYGCITSTACYATVDQAVQACGANSCVLCGPVMPGADGSAGQSSGPSGSNRGNFAIDVDFSATNFTDAQCDDLFNSMTPMGEGGQGGTPGSGGTGGSGGSGFGGVSNLSTVCNDFRSRATSYCGSTVSTAVIESALLSLGSCLVPTACQVAFESLLNCASTNFDSSTCEGSEIVESGYCLPEYANYTNCGGG